MSQSHSTWRQSLDPQRRAAIRSLHRGNSAWNLVAALFVLIWIGVAAIMLTVDSWLLYLPGYVIIGAIIYGTSNIMHEGVHGTMFRSRRWNRWLGFAMGAPSLYSFTAYRINHLLHHKYNRTDRDPNEFANVAKRGVSLPAVHYVWLVFGAALMVLRLPMVAMKHGTNADRRRLAVEYGMLLGLMGLVFVGAWRFDRLVDVIHAWLLPLAFATLVGNVRGLAEHAWTSPDDQLTNSRTVTSNRLFSFLNVNQNYHVEHHLFPGVPWYNLPKLHSILREEFARAGTPIYRSYAQLFWEAYRGQALAIDVSFTLPAAGGRSRRR